MFDVREVAIRICKVVLVGLTVVLMYRGFMFLLGGLICLAW